MSKCRMGISTGLFLVRTRPTMRSQPSSELLPLAMLGLQNVTCLQSFCLLKCLASRM